MGKAFADRVFPLFGGDVAIHSWSLYGDTTELELGNEASEHVSPFVISENPLDVEPLGKERLIGFISPRMLS